MTQVVDLDRELPRPPGRELHREPDRERRAPYEGWSARRVLMCPPEHFGVHYVINPWMRPEVPVDRARAMSQWEQLRRIYETLGHDVDVIEPGPGLPDMVFAANAGLVVDGRVLGARFRYRQRRGEEARYRRWFAEAGFGEVVRSRWVNEGEGDFVLAGPWLLAGTGFRTDVRAHADAQELLGRPVVGLQLVDPRYYHLDTALCALDTGTVAYHPGAFSPGSAGALSRLFPDAVVASDEDAAAFGLNAWSDGYHVVLPAGATGLEDQLRARGYEPIPVDVSELLKAGGGVKCCTLELREGRQ
jgi:N-dimethylarginine dimethylaminohydrolase